MLTLSDKVVHAYSLGSGRIEDGMEMIRIAAGLTETEPVKVAYADQYQFYIPTQA